MALLFFKFYYFLCIWLFLSVHHVYTLPSEDKISTGVGGAHL